MQLAPDIADFLAAPIGRCVAGPCWLYFYPREDVCGFVIWGRPDADAMASLVRVLRVELEAAPHVALVDAHGVEAVDAAAFEALRAYVEENQAALSRVVTKLALVTPRAGLMRAVAAGFFDVAPPPYPVARFDDASEAFAWLGAPPDVLAAIRAAEGAAMGVPASLRELRAWIEGHLHDATVETASRALGLSTRSLQRRLEKTGTTFQQELKIVQVKVAQRMLEGSDAPITTIAFDVGLSPTHFSAVFKSLTGLSPTEWRDRNRR